MRKTVLILGICCLLAAPAWAGSGFSLFGSYSEVSDEGQSFGAGARVSLGGARWVGDLTWTWYERADDILILTDPFIEDDIQVIPTDLGVRYIIPTQGSFQPYIGGGFTFFYNNLNQGRAENSLGGYILAGFNLGKSGTKFFGEVLYRMGESNVTYEPVPGQQTKQKVDVGGIGVNLGIVWTF